MCGVIFSHTNFSFSQEITNSNPQLISQASKLILPAEEGTYQIEIIGERPEEIELSNAILSEITAKRLTESDEIIVTQDYTIIIMSTSKMDAGVRWAKYKFLAK